MLLIQQKYFLDYFKIFENSTLRKFPAIQYVYHFLVLIPWHLSIDLHIILRYSPIHIRHMLQMSANYLVGYSASYIHSTACVWIDYEEQQNCASKVAFSNPVTYGMAVNYCSYLGYSLCDEHTYQPYIICSIKLKGEGHAKNFFL